MKKVLFVAAMFVAGSLSAKGFVENDNILVKESVEKQEASYSTTDRGIRVTTSCGNVYIIEFPKDWSTPRIIDWIMGFDAGNCI